MRMKTWLSCLLVIKTTSKAIVKSPLTREKELADSLGIKFLETSAKNSNNVDKTFFTLGNEIKMKIAKNDTPAPNNKS